MRAVIQRVQHASVSVDGTVRGAIGKGYLVLLGVGAEDDESHMRKVADKMLQLRIFEDENGKINRSLDQVQGELLVISQFTLYADCRKGRGYVPCRPAAVCTFGSRCTSARRIYSPAYNSSSITPTQSIRRRIFSKSIPSPQCEYGPMGLNYSNPAQW